MLVHKKSKKIVLNLKNPDRVTVPIPTAKTFMYKGTKLVAVPHKPDETKVLRNLGYDVPNPIRFHYEWPGQFKPFNAQLDTADFLTMNPRAFCLNDMGTGKTASTLWAYDYVRSTGQVRKALVVSPLSTLERTWADEIFRNFPHLNAAVLHGTRERRLKLLAQQDIDLYLINHDGVKIIAKELAERHDIDLIIVDEVASFRNASTDRWKTLNIIVNKQCPRRIWGLTGTPTPNLPTDAWAQCRLISPENVPPYFSKFRDLTMRQINQFKWVPRENATELVSEVMRPAIRFSREQCVDLPPVMFETRHVEMSPEQKKLYKDMLNKLHAEYAGGQVTAVNEAVKASKLVQIACGVAYTKDHDEMVIPAHSRIEVVKEIIEEAGAKVIVFVPFTGALTHIADELGEHFDVATLSGATPKRERDEIFRAFQHDNNPRVLVAQPAAMSHGLTLTAANTIVWFAPVNSNEIYSQANGRINRPGQKKKALIVNVEGSDVERKMYDRLKGKQKMQGLLLDLFKGV